jgi:hypothetical protein
LLPAMKRLNQWGPWLALLCAWLLKTWEIWRYLGERHYAVWGMFFDTLHMDWMSWWSSVAYTHPGQSLFHSTWINAPLGAPTVMNHSLASVHVALAGALRLVLGGIAAHNLVALLGCAFTLVALFLLLRHISGSGWLGALLAALVFTFGLGWAGTLPDLEVLYFGYAALALLAWLKFVEAGGRGRFIVASLLVAWTAFAQMYYGLSVLAMLATAMLMAWRGITLERVAPGTLLRRTGAVLAVGLTLAIAAHSRNIGTTFSMSGGGLEYALAPFPPNHLSQPLWRGFLMLLLFGGAAVAALRFRLYGALLWLGMVSPLVVLSLGEELGGIDMPLRYLRAIKPLFQRVSFGFRFVAPTLLGLAAFVAIVWRDRTRVLSLLTPWWSPNRLAVTLLSIFWIGAAFAPMIPRFERLPLAADSIDGAACGASLPDPCTMTQRWVNLCTPQAGKGEATTPSGPLLWGIGQLLRPLRPQRTVPLPTPPPCLQQLADAPGEGAVLEFSARGQNAYRGYFQTVHGRPLAGFPIRSGLERGISATAAAHAAFLYQQGNLPELPAADSLARDEVEFVVRYQSGPLPACDFGIPQRVDEGPPPGASWQGEADFLEAYGPPLCNDGVITLYSTGLGNGTGGGTLAP